jgi:hypothetical protein
MYVAWKRLEINTNIWWSGSLDCDRLACVDLDGVSYKMYYKEIESHEVGWVDLAQGSTPLTAFVCAVINDPGLQKAQKFDEELRVSQLLRKYNFMNWLFSIVLKKIKN